MQERNRLIELFNKIEKDPAITCPHYKTDKTCDVCKYTINNFMCNHTERTVDYLLSNGVIVPPCKVGDKVFWAATSIDENCEEIPTIEIGEVVSFSLQKEGLWAYCRYESGLTFWHLVVDYFGKTVFLTKEKAEQALAERGADNE